MVIYSRRACEQAFSIPTSDHIPCKDRASSTPESDVDLGLIHQSTSVIKVNNIICITCSSVHEPDRSYIGPQNEDLNPKSFCMYSVRPWSYLWGDSWHKQVRISWSAHCPRTHPYDVDSSRCPSSVDLPPLAWLLRVPRHRRVPLSASRSRCRGWWVCWSDDDVSIDRGMKLGIMSRRKKCHLNLRLAYLKHNEKGLYVSSSFRG